MTDPNPYDYIWWLASRASGIVALGLVTASVGLGLLMATKLLRRPGLNRVLVKLHEHLALTGLVAIAVHGITLLGDSLAEPGRRRRADPVHDVLPPAVHGARHRRRLPGGAARPVVLRRRRIGTRLWRKLHRATSARLRARGRACARRRDGRLDHLAARVPAGHRRADPVPAARADPAAPQARDRARPPGTSRPARFPPSAMAEGQR